MFDHVVLELRLGVAGTRNQDRSVAGKRFDDFFEEGCVHALVPASRYVCLVLQMPASCMRTDHDLLCSIFTDVEYLRLAVIHPENDVRLIGHDVLYRIDVRADACSTVSIGWIFETDPAAVCVSVRCPT